jgi:DNA-binding MarR family transcriptional regulator
MTRRSRAKAEAADEQLQSPPLVFAELDELLGYRMRRAQGAMHRAYMNAVGGLKLTQKQTATLWLIKANLGVSQVAVAAALGMDRATMMAVINRLQARGFVTRKRSTSDRRRQELYLTPAGDKALSKVKARIIEHEKRFRNLFEATELTALLSALQKFRSAD